MLSMGIFLLIFGANIDEFLLAAASECSCGFAGGRYVTHDHRPPLVGAHVRSEPANRSEVLRGGYMVVLAEEVSVGGSSET